MDNPQSPFRNPQLPADNATMTTSARIAASLLCRWCLLALGATAVALTTWASARASLAVPRQVGASLLLGDVLWRPVGHEGGLNVTGALDPPHLASGADVALTFSPPRRIGRVVAGWSACAASLRGLAPGLERLAVVGVPYGPYAFAAQDCLLAGVPPERPVFLLDVRLALAARHEQPAVMAACLDELRRRGQAALFFIGPPREAAECRARVRGFWQNLPLVLHSGKGGPVAALWYFGQPLGRIRGQGMEVITADAALAVEAARTGLTTHLIAAGQAPPPASPPRLTVHDSLGSFKDSLARSPIGR